MPEECQNLYFHLGMRADDDGIVETYPVMQLLGSSPDTLSMLFIKEFLVPLNQDQVVFISDWTEHNTIRADRKVDSVYKHLLIDMVPGAKVIEAKPRSDVVDNSKRLNGRSTDGVSKDKLSKDKLKYNGDFLFEKFWSAYPKKVGKQKCVQWFQKQKNTKNLTIDDVIDAVEKYKLTEGWQKEGGKYIPHPYTFLNGARWNDVIDSPMQVEKIEILDYT